jgi:hypothetical protein
VFEGDPTWAPEYHPQLRGFLRTIAQGFDYLGIDEMRALVNDLRGIRKGEPAQEQNGTVNALLLFRHIRLDQRTWDSGAPGMSGISYRASVAETKLDAVIGLAKELASRVDRALESEE